MGKTRITIAAALGVAMTVVGCAKRPDAIAPAAIPMAAYQNLDCQQLAAEYLAEYHNMQVLARAQNDAATGDAVGVFLVGLPLSSTFGGNKEGDLAVSKGKVQAMESAMLANQCDKPAEPDPLPIPRSSSNSPAPT